MSKIKMILFDIDGVINMVDDKEELHRHLKEVSNNYGIYIVGAEDMVIF